MAKTLQIGSYQISVGKPGLSGIVWWANIERVKFSYLDRVSSPRRPVFSSDPIFRVQFDDGTCPLAKYHRGWRRIV